MSFSRLSFSWARVDTFDAAFTALITTGIDARCSAERPDPDDAPAFAGGGGNTGRIGGRGETARTEGTLGRIGGSAMLATQGISIFIVLG